MGGGAPPGPGSVRRRRRRLRGGTRRLLGGSEAAQAQDGDGTEIDRIGSLAMAGTPSWLAVGAFEGPAAAFEDERASTLSDGFNGGAGVLFLPGVMGSVGKYSWEASNFPS